MKCRKLFIYVLSLIVLVLLFPLEPLAAPYYHGKTINIICGTGPGGGFDRIARIYAKFLPKYIPGKPTIIVENMPGAASIVAANYMYNIAKPDGLTIGIVNRGLPFAQLLKTEGVRFDLTKYAWVGSPSVESNVITVSSDTPYKSVADLRNAKGPIKLGAAGPASSSAHFPLLLKAFAGIKNIQMVYYRSSQEVALAIERREVDGKATSYTSFKTQILKGLYRPLLRGRISEPGIENLPIDEDLTNDPIGKKLMAMRSGPDRIGRPFFCPPKTPPEVMTILREAFAKASKDPEVDAMADKLEMRIEYVSAEECVKILKDLYSQPDNVVKEFAKHIKF